MVDTTNPIKEILPNPEIDYDENYPPLTEDEWNAITTNTEQAGNENLVAFGEKIAKFYDFTANLKRHDYITPNRFLIEFSLPDFTTEAKEIIGELNIPLMQERIVLAAESVDLPNRLLPTVDPRVGNFQIPFAHDYSSDLIQMQFRCSGDMFEKKLMDAWQAATVSISTGNANYPVNYKRDIVIKMLNRSLKTVYAIRLVGAFPSNISNISLNHDSNETAKFSVSFRYSWWQAETFKKEDFEFPTKSFKSEEEEALTSEQSADNLFRSQQTRINKELAAMEIDRNADAESGNIFDRISKNINKLFGSGGSLKDGASYIKSVKNDIEALEDGNVVDQANKLKFGKGLNNILSFLK